MTGPQPEHVSGDPFDDNPRVVMPFNGSSGSGDVTGDVVYANFGRLEDFDQLAADHVDLHGKIVITRYGGNFRGSRFTSPNSAAPPASSSTPTRRTMAISKEIPTPRVPGVPIAGCNAAPSSTFSSIPGIRRRRESPQRQDLPDWHALTQRATSRTSFQSPSATRMRSHLRALKGASVPQGWQGALPFRYHIGGQGGVKVHLVSIRITSGARSGM